MPSDKPSLAELHIDRDEAAPPSRWQRAVAVLIFVAICTGGYFWWHSRVPTVKTITVRPAASGTAGRTLLNASGYVTARREATVSSKVTGKVTEVLIEEGMKVRAGQVLARLDDSNVQASLKLAEAQFAVAESTVNETRVRLQEAERELRRVRQLAEQQVANQSELDRAEAEVNSLKARLELQQVEIGVAQQQVALWQQQLEDTMIRAPFDGVVTSKNAQPGEMISPISAGGGFTRTGICTIVDMDSLEVEVDVNESYINRVEANQPVETRLDAYPDWKIPGHVIAIIPTADRQKSTVRVRVGFETLDPRILPDMGIKVAFLSTDETAAPSQGVTLPRSVVRRHEGRDVVFVLRDGVLEERPVALGLVQGSDVTLMEGLQPGEKVIGEGPATLTAGMRVREVKP